MGRESVARAPPPAVLYVGTAAPRPSGERQLALNRSGVSLRLDSRGRLSPHWLLGFGQPLV